MTNASDALSASTRRRSGSATLSTCSCVSMPNGPSARVEHTISGPLVKRSGCTASSMPRVTASFEFGLTTRMRARVSGMPASRSASKPPGRLSRQQRGHDPLARQWKVADACPQRVRYRIADRRGGRSGGCLADAERVVVRRANQVNVDLGYLAEREHRVAIPVERRDAGPFDPHLLLEHPACRLDDATLKLIDGAVGIDHQACVGRAPDFLEANLLIDFEVNHDGRIGRAVLVFRKPDAAAATRAARRI